MQGRVEILASCCRNRDKLRPGGPLGSYICRHFLLVTDLNNSAEYSFAMAGPRVLKKGGGIVVLAITCNGKEGCGGGAA